jgi:hypothetical protein
MGRHAVRIRVKPGRGECPDNGPPVRRPPAGFLLGGAISKIHGSLVLRYRMRNRSTSLVAQSRPATPPLCRADRGPWKAREPNVAARQCLAVPPALRQVLREEEATEGYIDLLHQIHD